jgi:[acyl-carrier-protein] S-malonyltransferase
MALVFCFPGQGSLEPGMGREMAEAFPEAKAVFEQASAAAGFDVARLCFEGTEEELTETEVQQPALVATSVACLRAIEAAGLAADFVVGHSVGEYSALAACGALSDHDAVELVAERGRATAAAARVRPGAMAAILGLEDEVVEALCAGIEGVWPANYNCPGQIVVSGETAAVERLLEAAAERGARRVVKLRVTGAFHSPLVEGAAERMRAAVARFQFAEPSPPFMSTVTSRLEPAGRIGALLVDQLTAPVRFSHAVAELSGRGVDTFVEVGPGQVLAGIVKRCDRSLRTFSVGTPAALERLKEELAAAR